MLMIMCAGEIMSRMNILEVTMRNEQEASLMALEAILGGRAT